MSYVLNSLIESQTVLEKFISNSEEISKIEMAVDLLTQTIKARGHIFSCGNGGSMCDSMHFAGQGVID